MLQVDSHLIGWWCTKSSKEKKQDMDNINILEHSGVMCVLIPYAHL